jgi:predicted GNAT superfamily acetyltransferase
MPVPFIKILETPEEMTGVEDLQRIVWPGSETDIVPVNMLIAAIHNGGLVIGAFIEKQLIGFVFGFPGLESTPDGPRPKHCSHMLGIHPQHRDSGVGFLLKRAQWQMVRHQGLDHVTWTFDPLLSRNAYLNISKLGAVCNTYRRAEYGDDCYRSADGLRVDASHCHAANALALRTRDAPFSFRVRVRGQEPVCCVMPCAEKVIDLRGTPDGTARRAVPNRHG